MSGAHLVNIDYCDCIESDRALDKRTQLLHKKWFPATTARPNTVFTFDLLSTFHELTLQGKGNLFDFYHTILRKTDNANIQTPMVSKYYSDAVGNLTYSYSIDFLKSTERSGCGEI